MDFLTALGIKNISVVVAGGVGGMLSLRNYVELTVRGKIAVIFSSIAIANYATHPVAEWFGGMALSHLEAIAAALGLFGLSLVSAILHLIKTTDWDTVSRFTGGGK